ncbi:MAG: hypothetical protein ABIT96_12845 [Ferruginibacter sp.]
MRIFGFVVLLFSFLISVEVSAQKIIYPEFHREDDSEIQFEIIGKVGSNYLVYKNLRSWKHVFEVFDEKMNSLSNKRADFISDKTNNIDFIAYNDFFYSIYQYQKNSIVYCDIVAIDGNGKKISNPVTLDTTKIGYIRNNNIYFTRFSEDKSKILIYKIIEKNEKLTLVTKLYDNKLTLLDSVRKVVPYNSRREVYTDLQVDNAGGIIYARELKSGFRENISDVEIYNQKPGKAIEVRKLPLENIFIDELKMKIDNLNNTIIINAFYYSNKIGSIQGIVTGLWNRETNGLKTAVNALPDTLRMMTQLNDKRQAFDDFFLKDIFVKKDGSFMLVAEDYSVISRFSNYPWNRWDYLYNGMYSPSDYYYGNSSNYPYYRYRNSISGSSYTYRNVLLLGINKDLQLEWSNMIMKYQTAENKDIFLSYTTLNTGNEIHFLFIDKEKNTEIITNQSLSAEGSIVRYPTIKSRESGYDFMPRLSKQVGIKDIIIPSLYRGFVVFTKIEF